MDTNKLKELAERAQISRGGEWYNEGDCCWWTGRPDEGDFMAACTPQAVLELIAEVERLNEALALAKQDPLYSTRRDAERYRWLRDLPRGTSHGDLTIMLAKNRPAPNQWCTDTIRGESLDAAIDAALEGGGR